MPSIVELRLKASWQALPDTRQLHGLACSLFGHDPFFTVWPLRGTPHGADYDWGFRASWLPGTLPPATALTTEQLRHGHVTCTVTETRHRSTTFAQIAAGTPARTVRVEFSSPTYFSQNGASVLVPD